jgi:hypothetical protein
MVVVLVGTFPEAFKIASPAKAGVCPRRRARAQAAIAVMSVRL